MTNVRLESVSKSFGNVVAVDNVSLDVTSGSFLTLLGPSGCGKTTILRLIAGFLRPDSGSIFIGNELVNLKKPYRRNTGLVFQNYALFPHMTVFKNICFGLEMKQSSRSETYDRVSKVLHLVRLEGLETRYPRQLSGGQQQRVALARAIVTEPEVLLLDEPLSNLDLVIRHQMRAEIKRIQSELGVTTVYVTHDQGEALSMSDEVAVVKDGKIVQVGDPLRIYEKPADEFVASFIGDANFFTGRVTEEVEDAFRVVVDENLLLVIPRDRVTLKVGDSVVLFARPEAIRLLSLADAMNPAVKYETATISDRTFLGSMTRYMVELGSIHFNVDVQNLGTKVYSKGEKVACVFDPAAFNVFAAS